MSDVQAAPAAVAVPAATETVPTPAAETAPVLASSTETPAAAPVETAPGAVAAATAAPAAAAAETEATPVEPVNEGLLGYKAPGLLKQFTFAKKDCWFTDEAVAPENLSSYLRGEKAEISHPVVAYASQTGKGLLFFAKKGENDKSKPAGVLPLYEATDLKKTSQQEFTFRLQGQSHTFKASSEAERDGWYQSIEKSMELGKAQKETVVESEGYKAELQKLGAPAVTPAGGAAAATVAAATGAGTGAVVASRKSTDMDRAEGVRPTSDDDEDSKRPQKSRSTSRGLLARLARKKDELEAKIEENMKEHEAEVEEKRAEKEAEKAAVAAEVADLHAADAPAATTSTTEKPRPVKRGSSIFGSLVSGFKGPAKEKDAKDSELSSERAVSDVAPQLPETAAAPAIVEPAAAPATETPAVAAVEPETKAEEVVTPGREKKNFLSGFLNKRERSVSPSAATKETPVVTEPAVATEPTSAVEAPAAVAGTEPEMAKEEEAPVNRRQSVFGGLGRRASKMISRMSSSTKDVTPAAETSATETTAAPAIAEDDLAAHEATEPVAAATETKPIAEAENKPEVVATPFGTTVTASA